MYFTEGKLIEYERIMREIPDYDRKPIKSAKKRDCKLCIYYDDYRQKCSKEKCPVFEE